MFRDVETTVDEASDTVCQAGLDDGAVVVENDDSQDAEERRVARFVAMGCKCKLNDGSPCHTLFSTSQVQRARDECHHLTWDQLDMVVMGQLRAVCQSDSMTQKTKARNVERKRTSTQYRFWGAPNMPGNLSFPAYHVCHSLRVHQVKLAGEWSVTTGTFRCPAPQHHTTF